MKKMSKAVVLTLTLHAHSSQDLLTELTTILYKLEKSEHYTKLYGKKEITLEDITTFDLNKPVVSTFDRLLQYPEVDNYDHKTMQLIRQIWDEASQKPAWADATSWAHFRSDVCSSAGNRFRNKCGYLPIRGWPDTDIGYLASIQPKLLIRNVELKVGAYDPDTETVGVKITWSVHGGSAINVESDDEEFTVKGDCPDEDNSTRSKLADDCKLPCVEKPGTETGALDYHSALPLPHCYKAADTPKSHDSVYTINTSGDLHTDLFYPALD